MTETLITKPSKDYELIDSGEGEKLERYGRFILRRPDPQALWPKNLNDLEWQKSDGFFGKALPSPNPSQDREGRNQSGWKFKKGIPTQWEIGLNDLKFIVKPTAFKHTGLFPEQLSNWEWIKERVEGQKSKVTERPVMTLSSRRSVIPAHLSPGSKNNPSILNLFGYTGGASLAAAAGGASVTHVDGSKSAITWAKENARLSGLESAPIRWILDDSRKFLEREIKRGNFYDGIIMDPPSFGHGPKKELWKIEDHFLDLLKLSQKVLSAKPVFFLINGYASGYSALAYENNLLFLKDKFGGKIEKGELTIMESKGGRLLPCGIFGRWQR